MFSTKSVLKLSCGHIVMRTRKPYYHNPSDSWWCPSCQCYKPIVKVIENYMEGFVYD